MADDVSQRWSQFGGATGVKSGSEAVLAGGGHSHALIAAAAAHVRMEFPLRDNWR